MEKDQSETIQIKDKRRFNPDGTSRTDITENTESVDQIQKKSEEKPKVASRSEEYPINFSTFVFSLASSAQMALGFIPHPQTGQPQINLDSAKQTIDILDMIEDKTKNNLTKEEDQLLKHVLHDLHMSYVKLHQQKKE